MALIIDIQGADHQDAKDAEAYFAKLGADIEDLRDRRIPVTWVGMGDETHKNTLYKPKETGPGAHTRSLGELAAMGFGGDDPSNKGHDIFRKFLQNHGPRTDEAIYSKFFMGAFVEPRDYAHNSGLREVIQKDFGKGTELPAPEAFDGQETLTHYARSQGVKNVLIVGALSTNCVTQTALSAVKKGFHAMIGMDGVLSWAGDEAKVDPKTSDMIWRAGESSRSQDAYHREKIDKRLDELTSDEKKAWGLTDQQINGLRASFTTLSNFIASQPLPETGGRNSRPQAGNFSKLKADGATARLHLGRQETKQLKGSQVGSKLDVPSA